MVSAAAISLSSCGSSVSTNYNTSLLDAEFAKLETTNGFNEYSKNIGGSYFDWTKELLVKSGYCTQDDSISSPDLIIPVNQDSNKLKVKLTFNILRSGTSEKIETAEISTGINLININSTILTSKFGVSPLTASELVALTPDRLLETLKNLNCINNIEFIKSGLCSLKINNQDFPITSSIAASRATSSLKNFKINLSLSCDADSVFIVDNQYSSSTLQTQTFSHLIDNVQLSNDDLIAQSMWNYEDSSKTIINGLSDFGKTLSTLVIPSNVRTIKRILPANQSSNVTEIQFNKGSNLTRIGQSAFEGF
ncbi:MAG: hypothetical protein K2N40_00465, partial [Ureaplasma sp.]|nr:hypothetical protein [Ureaplasma sp.]